MKKSILFILIAPLFLIGESMSVREAVEFANKNNKDIQMQKKSVTIKNLQYSKSFLYYLPEINLNTSWSKTGSNHPYQSVIDSGYSGTISLTQPIFNYNYIEGVAFANIDKVKEEISFELVKMNVEIGTISKFYNVLSLFNEEKAAKFLLEKSSQTFKMVESKYELRSANKSEYLKAKVDYINSEINYNTVKSNLDISKKELFNYIGIKYTDCILEDDISIDTLQIEDLEILKERLTKYDPQILAEKINLQYSMSMLRSSISDFLPYINWNLSYSTRVDNIPTFSNWEDGDNWSTSISFVLPLFKGGRRAIDIAENKINYQKSKINYKKAIEDRIRELLEKISDVRGGYLTYTSAIDAEEMAKENFNISEIQYKNGSISQIEYLNAKKIYEDAKSNLIRSKYAYLTNRLQLDVMTGKWKGE
jgi:outer membrane protein TolC